MPGSAATFMAFYMALGRGGVAAARGAGLNRNKSPLAPARRLPRTPPPASHPSGAGHAAAWAEPESVRSVMFEIVEITASCSF